MIVARGIRIIFLDRDSESTVLVDINWTTTCCFKYDIVRGQNQPPLLPAIDGNQHNPLHHPAFQHDFKELCLTQILISTMTLCFILP